MNQTFKKYTFIEFLNLDQKERERYEATGKLLKAKSFGVSDVMKWDYLTVKEIQAKLSNSIDYQGIIDIIQELTAWGIEKIMQKTWIDIFQFLKFVDESIQKITEKEENLSYDPDADEENAGIENYNQFGYFATIDRLAGGDPLKYESIGKMEYSIIYAKLLLNKVDSEFIKNYHRIKSKSKS